MSNINFFRVMQPGNSTITPITPISLLGNTSFNGVNKIIYLRNIDNNTARTLVVSVDYKMVINTFSTNSISIDNVINGVQGETTNVLNFTSLNQTISVNHSISLSGNGGTRLIAVFRTVRTPVEFLKFVRLESTITACVDNFDNTTSTFEINNRQVLATSISTNGSTTSGGATSPYTTRFFGSSPNINTTILAPTVGNIVWTNSLGTTPFNGGDLYYRDENFNGLVYRINSSGEVTERNP